MRCTIICFLFSFIVNIHGKSIPFIQNVFLQPSSVMNINISIHLNNTCQQCLCEFLNSENNNVYIAFNCFMNGTCQFFQTFPVTYTLQSLVGAKLCFLQGIFPNTSKCCMPDISVLLARLQNATPIIANIGFMPSTFGYDETKPDELAVLGRYGGTVHYYNPVNLTLIRTIWITNASLSLALYNNSVFTAMDQIPAAYVSDSQTGNLTTTINHTTLSKVRKNIFINNGQNMIVTAQNNQVLAFFDVNSPTNFTFQQSIPFPFSLVHGLVKVNDTFLYATSWTNRSIVSYNYQNLTWNYQTFAMIAGTGSASHIAVDDCGRVWVIINSFGLHIYDQSGMEIGNWTMATGSSSIYDLLFLSNYVLFITRKQDQQIVRYDPQISC